MKGEWIMRRLFSTLFFTLGLSFATSASATWYVGTVQQVTSRGGGVERLYIAAVPDGATWTPNPAKCAGGFAGAAWVTDGSSAKYAMSVALLAKAMGLQVRFEISDTTCYIDHPVLNWITLL
jgi:hypothetical protein